MDLKKVYSFNTLAPAILGSTFSSMKLIGILTAEEAVKIYDVATLHATLRTSITNLPLTINDCTFYLFTNANGEKVVMANEWINQQSISETSTITLHITVPNVDTSMQPVISNMFREIGIYNAELTLVTV